jgi:hypothetical protein
LTKDVIAFSRVGEDVLLDAVPLAEVIGIDPLQTADTSDESINNFETSVDFSNAFQIRTKKNGFNAGRKYIVQSNSDSMMNELITEMSEIIRVISEKLATKTKWGKVQKRVRRIYDSSLFQGSAAFLIVAVNCSSLIMVQIRRDV